MEARFASLGEQTRLWEHNRRDRRDRSRERRQVHALCDAVQLAVAEQRHERVRLLLREMHDLVDAALARRRG